MNSTVSSSDDEIYVLSSADLNDGSSSTYSSSLVNDSTSLSSNSYTPEQLNRFLSRKDENFRLENNNSTKVLALWWCSFGYVTVKNNRNEFERINGFISCFKCYRTFRYGSASGTKRFAEHADRCFPLISSNSASNDARGSKSIQYKLNQVGFRSKTKLTVQEKRELRELCAKWIFTDLRSFTIVEDYGFERLVSMFIKIGETITLEPKADYMPF